MSSRHKARLNFSERLLNFTVALMVSGALLGVLALLAGGTGEW